MSPEEIREEMRLFLASVIQYFPEEVRSRILLTAPAPIRGDISEYEYCGLASDRSHELGKQYESLASDLGIFFLDAGALGLKLGGDGLHFTEEDHRHFAEAIRKRWRRSGTGTEYSDEKRRYSPYAGHKYFQESSDINSTGWEKIPRKVHRGRLCTDRGVFV